MSDFEFKKAPGVAANYVSVVEDETQNILTLVLTLLMFLLKSVLIKLQ